MRPRPMVPFSLILKKRRRRLLPELRENTKFGCQMEGNFENAKTLWLTSAFLVFSLSFRLMVVSYYVDGESGFVPTITFEDGYTPEWKEK